jgi:hypothetical protein
MTQASSTTRKRNNNGMSRPDGVPSGGGSMARSSAWPPAVSKKRRTTTEDESASPHAIAASSRSSSCSSSPFLEPSSEPQPTKEEEEVEERQRQEDPETLGAGHRAAREGLLGRMMDLHVTRNSSRTTFCKIMEALGRNDRNSTWRSAWRGLIEMGYVAGTETPSPTTFTSDHELTDWGLRHGTTDEIRAALQERDRPVGTTADLHDRIRAVHCKGRNGRAVQIFDLLLRHGPCRRRDLAALMGISDRGANFHYGLQNLLKTGHVVEADPPPGGGTGPKRLQLADKCFLDPAVDRPDPVPVDQALLSEGMERVYGREMKRKAAAGQAGK